MGNRGRIDGQIYSAILELQTRNCMDANRLVTLTYNYVNPLILQIVKDQNVANALTNQAYATIYQKIDFLNDPDDFYVWAGSIVTDTALSYIQKNRPEQLQFGEIVEDGSFAFAKAEDDTEAFIPESVLVDHEKQRLIMEQLNSLSILHRICIQYFYYEELSVSEIAVRCGVSESLVKRCLLDARNIVFFMFPKVEDGNTKLYSLATLPLFYVAFIQMIHQVLSAGAVAGGATIATGGISLSGVAGTGVVGTGTTGTGVVGAGAVGSGTTGTGVVGAGAVGSGTTGVVGTGAAGASGLGATGTTGASGLGGAGTVGSLAAGTGAAAASNAGVVVTQGFLAKLLGTIGGKIAIGILALTLVGGGTYLVVENIIHEDQEKEVVLADEDTTVDPYESLVSVTDVIVEEAESEEEMIVEEQIDTATILEQYYTEVVLMENPLASQDLVAYGSADENEMGYSFDEFSTEGGTVGKMMVDLDADGQDEMMVSILDLTGVEGQIRVLLFKYQNGEVVELTNNVLRSMTFGYKNDTVQMAYRVLDDGFYVYFTDVFTMTYNEGGYGYAWPVIFRYDAAGLTQLVEDYDASVTFYTNNLMESARSYMDTIVDAWYSLGDSTGYDFVNDIFNRSVSEDRYSTVLFIPLSKTDASYVDVMTFQMLQERGTTSYRDCYRDGELHAFWEFYGE